MNVNENFYSQTRKKSQQYKQLLKAILRGKIHKTVQKILAYTVLSPNSLRYKLSEGIPLITERNLAVCSKNRPPLWRQAIAEIIAFINGARTVKELESYGCYFWSKGNLVGQEKCSRFGLRAGDLGPGSYGHAFAKFPKPNGGHFNQIEAVVEQIKNFPETRTHVVNPWIPYYALWENRKCVCTPCHGNMYFRVNNDELSLVMTQRAADVPIGTPFNMFQYAVLLLMVAQVTDLKPHEFVYSTIDAHVYVNQLEAAKTMLKRTDRCLPIIKVNPDISDLFSFRTSDFKLEKYNPHPVIRNIAVADV